MDEQHQPADTGALAAALAAAQAEYKPLKRTRTVKVRMKSGGEYSFKYAPLDVCMDATRPALTKHGLAVTQAFETEPLRIVTRLLHESGQYMESVLPLREQATPQDLGGEMTYMRRYSYVALVGIVADEDTDGPPQPNATDYTHGPSDDAPPKARGKGKGPTEAQLKRLFAIAKKAGWTTDQLKTHLLLMYRVEHTKELTREQYNELCGDDKQAGTLAAGPPKDEPPPGTEAGDGGDPDAAYIAFAERVQAAIDSHDKKALRALLMESGTVKGLTEDHKEALAKMFEEGLKDNGKDGDS